MTRVGAGPADDQVGGGVGEVHPVDVVARTTYGGVGRRARRRPRRCGPDDVQHLDAGRGRARAAAPETDWLSRRAPCEPPVTSSVGRSGSSPKRRAGLGAQRGAVEAWRSSAGSAARRTSACGSGVSGKLVATCVANRAPSLVGEAGQGVLLVHDERQLAAAGGEVRRHRDVAAEADDDVGADPVEDRRASRVTAPRSRPGTRSRSATGRRGSGTGGISSSG